MGSAAANILLQQETGGASERQTAGFIPDPSTASEHVDLEVIPLGDSNATGPWLDGWNLLMPSFLHQVPNKNAGEVGKEKEVTRHLTAILTI